MITIDDIVDEREGSRSRQAIPAELVRIDQPTGLPSTRMKLIQLGMGSAPAASEGFGAEHPPQSANRCAGLKGYSRSTPTLQPVGDGAHRHVQPFRRLGGDATGVEVGLQRGQEAEAAASLTASGLSAACTRSTMAGRAARPVNEQVMGADNRAVHVQRRPC